MRPRARTKNKTTSRKRTSPLKLAEKLKQEREMFRTIAERNRRET